MLVKVSIENFKSFDNKIDDKFTFSYYFADLLS